MADLYFTADTHFGHRRMASTWRPRFGGDIDAMDEWLIDQWNQTVGKTDHVYHLGDFTFRTRAQTEAILDRLNGQIYFIRGNHDHTTDRLRQYFVLYKDYTELKVGDQRLVLMHFPIASWHKISHGAWHLHGHCHGNLPDVGKLARMDVGVDTNATLRPYHYDEIAEFMEGRDGLPGDHHAPIATDSDADCPIH